MKRSMNEMKRFRECFGLTQKQVAEALGFSDSRAIRRIESGESRLTGTAAKAMQYYKVVILEQALCEVGREEEVMFSYTGNPYDNFQYPTYVSGNYHHPEFGWQRSGEFVQAAPFEDMKDRLRSIAFVVKSGPDQIGTS
ncbi:MAG: helix-turn-helix transcriptional regulator [Sneathiella sp.]